MSCTFNNPAINEIATKIPRPRTTLAALNRLLPHSPTAIIFRGLPLSNSHFSRTILSHRVIPIPILFGFNSQLFSVIRGSACRTRIVFQICFILFNGSLGCLYIDEVFRISIVVVLESSGDSANSMK